MRQGAQFSLFLCVNVRKAFNLPESLLGNFIFHAIPDAVDASTKSLGELALAFRTAIKE
jgi:hypothetical protein